ncbi:MAG: hypothetical protein JWN58_2594 [Gammaproteobacteria bacterium]|jgi:uncharacterized protein (TIGR02001 family)|nr:hypothetical protein [Gammaproteobacteria bacterium]
MSADHNADRTFECSADKRYAGCDVVRLFTGCAVLLLGLAAAAPRCFGADQWGGSLSITSDYIVRGVSRTNYGPALQGDLHYYSGSGFVAGLFASNTKFDPEDRPDVEVDAYLGFAWTLDSDWSGRILASHYTYPWSPAGSGYDYDEFDVTVVFQEWLSATLAYSPNAWRDLPSGDLIGVPNEVAEIGLQRPILGKLSGTASIGYSHFAGPPQPEGYAFWSLGAAYDLAPVAILVSYVKTTPEAKALFYNAAGNWRWTGTVIWRF